MGLAGRKEAPPAPCEAGGALVLPTRPPTYVAFRGTAPEPPGQGSALHPEERVAERAETRMWRRAFMRRASGGELLLGLLGLLALLHFDAGEGFTDDVRAFAAGADLLVDGEGLAEKILGLL
jgi:hypothetical protein